MVNLFFNGNPTDDRLKNKERAVIWEKNSNRERFFARNFSTLALLLAFILILTS